MTGNLAKKEPTAILVIRWVIDYMHVGLTSLGAVATAIGGGLVSIWSPNRSAWIHTWPGWLLLGGALVTLVGAYLSAARQVRLSQLEETAAQLRRRIAGLENELGQTQETHQKLVRDYLANLANRLGFSGSERISLYAHDGERFYLLGRYSERPEFDRRGRAYYNHNEGVIGKAWAAKDGKAFLSGLPDPDRDWQGYADRLLRECSIGEETAKGFAMKSRCLAACAVLDTAKAGRQRIAVMVVESILPTGVDADKAFGAIQTSQKGLRALLKKVKPNIPKPEIARRAGF